MSENWKADLKRAFEKQQKDRETAAKQTDTDRDRVRRFIASVVVPAFEEVQAEMKKYGMEFDISHNSESASFKAKDPSLHFRYVIKARGAHPYPEIHFRENDGQRYKAEGHLHSGSQDYSVDSITKEEIIADLVKTIQQTLLG